MALSSVVSGFSFAAQLVSKIIVGQVAAENFCQVGRSAGLGSPLRAKATQAVETFAARDWDSGLLVVMFSARAVLLKQKAISAQWNARGRASRTGVFHWNQ